MSTAKKKGLTYRDAGVDIDAGDQMVERIQKLCQSTYGPQVLAGVGGFAACFQLDGQMGLLSKKMRNPVLVSSTDGVGTKLKVAFLTGVHDTIGIDLVAMSVNDMITTGATPLFFLDYFATGRLDPGVGEQVVKGIAAGCKQSRSALIGGETAELPGFYADGEYDLAGFAVGVVEKAKIIDGSHVEPGDVILGMASTGLHSNGYSLARKVLIELSGWKLDEDIPEFGHTLAEEMLTPTRIYVEPLLKLFTEYRVKKVVRALAHITGSGLPGNVPRVLPAGAAARVHKGSWPVPPVFTAIQRIGGVAEEEMYNTFNMGIGMIMVCPEYFSRAIARRLRRLGVPTWPIGEIVERPSGAPDFEFAS